MDQILFFLFGPLAVIAALGTITLRNPFYAVLSLVLHLLSLAMLFLLLYAQFVAVVQVMVYVGAVMVLYVFVNAYVGGTVDSSGQVSSDGTSSNGRSGGTSPNLRLLSYAIGGALALTIGIAVLGTGLQAIEGPGGPISSDFGSPSTIGELLLTRFLLPFEIASFLLLVAAIGAVLLARRRGGTLPGEDQMISALDLFAPIGTGTMREGVGAINPVPGARSVPLTPSTGPSAPGGLGESVDDGAADGDRREGEDAR